MICPALQSLVGNVEGRPSLLTSGPCPNYYATWLNNPQPRSWKKQASGQAPSPPAQPSWPHRLATTYSTTQHVMRLAGSGAAVSRGILYLYPPCHNCAEGMRNAQDISG